MEFHVEYNIIYFQSNRLDQINLRNCSMSSLQMRQELVFTLEKQRISLALTERKDLVTLQPILCLGNQKFLRLLVRTNKEEPDRIPHYQPNHRVGTTLLQADFPCLIHFPLSCQPCIPCQKVVGTFFLSLHLTNYIIKSSCSTSKCCISVSLNCLG